MKLWNFFRNFLTKKAKKRGSTITGKTLLAKIKNWTKKDPLSTSQNIGNTSGIAIADAILLSNMKDVRDDSFPPSFPANTAAEAAVGVIKQIIIPSIGILYEESLLKAINKANINTIKTWIAIM